ncbi:MAG: tyrosine phenol-lyase [Bacteroidetes bacterium]|nr:MAG: tyrosine phenol-lyase [Bacteroidota bacterium]REK05257.1 MAG: tyrosine phenol-lyase [Bacteroidota bacterium]REK32662.1 MAG: tyrosine phenol-lyase [Bacteroidota bacterium]REK48891.1 MAG: tyrosine phenol-lyase [Bacteroidota bacterium]
MEFKTIIEPFRIKSVEQIQLSTAEQRQKFIREAHYNPFLLRSNQVIIDLLTDSGTSAMSADQWAAIMRGDESYAGAESWYRFESAVSDLTGMPFILPAHQGRAAERILYSIRGGKDKMFVSNTHFDTTRANIEFTGAMAMDIPVKESANFSSEERFKGNLDLKLLEDQILANGPENMGGVIVTVTNNSGGGQPVSFSNLKEVSRICRQHNVMLILDACRIAENAYFIREFEKGCEQYSYSEIARMMCDLCDAVIMSAKKDALVNMGGFLALRDKKLADECIQSLIITEGFTTYGGLSGRDMEAIAVGLKEVFNPDYLRYRVRSTGYLGDSLKKSGIPVMSPSGGHAVYIVASEFYSHIPVNQYPGQTLVCELYKAGGIRAVEVGSVMFGKYDEKGDLIPARYELVRLAIPRRVYTQSHIDYVIEVCDHVYKNRKEARGMKITYEPGFLRHFTSRFEPV